MAPNRHGGGMTRYHDSQLCQMTCALVASILTATDAPGWVREGSTLVGPSETEPKAVAAMNRHRPGMLIPVSEPDGPGRVRVGFVTHPEWVRLEALTVR